MLRIVGRRVLASGKTVLGKRGIGVGVGGIRGMASVSFQFMNAEGELMKEVSGEEGENLLEIAHREGIPMEGACEGVCACSTCHVILEDSVYDSLPEASEDEEDMLDIAPGLTLTSRLGCQVELDASMEGMEVRLPAVTRNFYVDGHVPQPH